MMTDIQEKLAQDANYFECNDNFITEVFEIAFGEGARDRYTNEEAVTMLREFSDKALAAENPVRKIVQILKTDLDGRKFNSITALCDDGTIWQQTKDDDDIGWVLNSDPIPQEPIM